MTYPRRTEGAYVLETLPTKDDDGAVTRHQVETMANRIYDDWVRLGYPAGEFMVEFASRRRTDG